MTAFMYHINSAWIAGILFVSMAVAVEAGSRAGRRVQKFTDAASKDHVNAIQASLLGILALLLGFTFSLSLQRYDSRSQAVVREANAIGTTYLRAQLLPVSVRHDVQQSLREYLNLRVQMSTVPITDRVEREALLVKVGRFHSTFWNHARLAVGEDPNPVTTGLFIQSLNELIDDFAEQDELLTRHVPEVVLVLLFGT